MVLEWLRIVRFSPGIANASTLLFPLAIATPSLD
jgi:hypothetical protein